VARRLDWYEECRGVLACDLASIDEYASVRESAAIVWPFELENPP
jgi:hypothetical protein